MGCGKCFVERKRLTIVVIIGIIVTETCFKRKVYGDRVNVAVSIRRGLQKISDFINIC